jgi:hypothetical protein
MKKVLFPLLLTLLIISGCKKDPIVVPTFVPDNTAPYYGEVPKVALENYINRIFIDLIGREPLDAEMLKEEDVLRATHISADSREKLILKLQTNEDYILGDSSYKYAYYNRFYELSKARVLEAASNDVLRERTGEILYQAKLDSLNGDSLNLSLNNQMARKLFNVIDCEKNYRLKTVEIRDIFARMVNNSIYDQINMNSFNFINATFNDLFFRYPTANEFKAAYDMVEYNLPTSLLGKSGQNKGDYIQILVNSDEFYEGIIRWMYKNLLAREPSTQELYTDMQTFFSDHDVQKIQLKIMKSDEYANFK